MFENLFACFTHPMVIYSLIFIFAFMVVMAMILIVAMIVEHFKDR